jgi:hypothetical protein
VFIGHVNHCQAGDYSDQASRTLEISLQLIRTKSSVIHILVFVASSGVITKGY